MKFQRGRLELLAEISKTNQSDMAEQEEIDGLNEQVKELRSRLDFMTNYISKLTDMMYSVPQTPAVEQEIKHESPKCCETNHFHYYTWQQQQNSTMSSALPVTMPKLPLHDPVYSENISSSDFHIPSMREVQDYPDTATPSAVASPSQSFNFQSSFDYVTEKDFAADIFINDLDTIDDFSTLPLSGSSPLDPRPEQKLRDSLALFPKQVQEMFVERLITSIADPDHFNGHVQTVSALATAVAKETHIQVQMLADNGTRDNNTYNNVNPASPDIKQQQTPTVAQRNNNKSDYVSSNDHPFIELPLATTTLEAFLAQYSNDAKKEQTCLTATPTSPSRVSLKS